MDWTCKSTIIKNMAYKFTSQSSEVQAYLKSIRKYKVMTDDEEKEAFAAYKSTGDRAAFDRIVNSNQRIVFSEAKKFARREADIMDFVDDGNIGLIQAVDKFDPSLGYKFITLAIYYIRRNMGNFSFDNAEIKKSNAAKYLSAVAKIKKEFFQREMRDPSTYEIIDELNERGFAVKDARDILDVNIKSIDDPVSDDINYAESEEFSRASASINTIEKKIDKEDKDAKATAALSAIDQRSKDIIRMSFGIGFDKQYTDTEIAKHFGLTNMRISQLKRDALKKMKAHATA